MSLTSRQQIIFKTIVEQFIRIGEPIGSKALLPLLDFRISPATIRNEMAVLEKEGLLEKTHTSSGRVPSLSGYRYYITQLMDFNLDDQLSNALRQVFEKRHYTIDEIVEVSCTLLSEMTHLTSIALGPQKSLDKLHSLQLVPLDSNSAVAILIAESGHSQSKVFSYEKDLSFEEIRQATALLNQILAGLYLSEIPDKILEAKKSLSSSLARYEVLLDAFVAAFLQALDSKRVVHGRFQLLAQPEFSDVEKLQELMRLLEDSSLFQAWLSSSSLPALSIGRHNELIQIGEASVVVSTFRIGAGQRGQLMVLGPNRMNYAKILPLIDYMSEVIEGVFEVSGGEDDSGTK